MLNTISPVLNNKKFIIKRLRKKRIKIRYYHFNSWFKIKKFSVITIKDSIQIEEHDVAKCRYAYYYYLYFNVCHSCKTSSVKHANYSNIRSLPFVL